MKMATPVWNRVRARSIMGGSEGQEHQRSSTATFAGEVGWRCASWHRLQAGGILPGDDPRELL